MEVSRAIAQAAERLGVDLIVMASHGRTGALRLVLGSVAQAVLTRTHKPVTVIRPPE
ncbi:MAG: universal stress protein [Myxococcaceae bacterium]